MPRRLAPLLAAAALAACVKYQPAPLAPETTGAALAARSLADTGLRAFLGAHAALPAAGAPWTPRELGLAAWYLRPELETARAARRTVAAGEVTAGTRPPLSGGVGVQRAFQQQIFESPWVVEIGVAFRVELGGKRDARVAAARARTAAATVDVERTAWELLHTARGAAEDVVASDAGLRAVERQAAEAAGVAEEAAQRRAEGVVGGREVADANAEAARLAGAVARARADLQDARAVLARSLGIAATEAAGVEVAPDTAGGCRLATRWPRDTVQLVALRRRYEVGAALAAYAVAEADLRLEVARQYPELEIGPGFIWDQGINRWSLFTGIPALLTGRNRGPIGEAIARREEQGTRVREVQGAVLADVDAAAASCAGARQELDAARQAVASAEAAVTAAAGAQERGETGARPVLLARARLADAVAAAVAAGRRLVEAGQRLEAALAWWGEEADGWPDPLVVPAYGGGPR